VVRENVPASDDKDFEAGLDVLGYRPFIVRTNARQVVGQNRVRDFIVGCTKTSRARRAQELLAAKGDSGVLPTNFRSLQVIPCLTTNRTRYDSRDCYIFDGRLRILDSAERTVFAGFPIGWFDGLSEAAVATMTGNAVVPQVVSYIFAAIKATE
jgi:site-specific DNA-cytosine methylase